MQLSADDLACWSQALARLPRSKEGVGGWISTELHAFFPFRQLFLAHGELTVGQIVVTHSTSFGHEQAYLGQLATTFDIGSRTSLVWWLQHRQPFVIDLERPPPFASQFELDEIKHFGLGNVAAHGVVNLKSNAGSYFSFAGVREPLGAWHIDALRLIAPVLNELFLLTIVTPHPTKHLLDRLTPRQLEIVRRLVACQDDKSIARTLGISERTVRNQLSAVYDKFGVHKRTELIDMLR